MYSLYPVTRKNQFGNLLRNIWLGTLPSPWDVQLFLQYDASSWLSWNYNLEQNNNSTTIMLDNRRFLLLLVRTRLSVLHSYVHTKKYVTSFVSSVKKHWPLIWLSVPPVSLRETSRSIDMGGVECGTCWGTVHVKLSNPTNKSSQ